MGGLGMETATQSGSSLVSSAEMGNKHKLHRE